jgi:protein involved in polysaccharide export with SLBB domain
MIQTSIHALTAMRKAVSIAGTVTIADIHKKEPRQKRRNEMSDAAFTALKELYEILQAKAFDEEKLMKAEGYMVFARVAEVNEVLLRDAGDEELFEKLDALEQENLKFEEDTEQHTSYEEKQLGC